MKIEELIDELQQVKEENGNLELVAYNTWSDKHNWKVEERHGKCGIWTRTL